MFSPRHGRSASLRQVAAIAFGLVIGAIVGCQKNPHATFPVVGTIAFTDGEPVTWGLLEFQSVDGAVSARGAIQPDGTFQLGTYADRDGAIAGKHRVLVMQVVMTDKLKASQHRHGATVAARYARLETSGLEFEILPQSNTLRIVVEKAKP